MTDQTWHTTLLGTGKIASDRATLNTNYGNARMQTIEGSGLIASDKTLDKTQDIVLFDTSAAGRTATLPATPEEGDTYEVGASSASFNVTVDRNGSNINAAASNDTVSGAYASKRYTYIDATVGWWSR